MSDYYARGVLFEKSAPLALTPQKLLYYKKNKVQPKPICRFKLYLILF